MNLLVEWPFQYKWTKELEEKSRIQKILLENEFIPTPSIAKLTLKHSALCSKRLGTVLLNILS